MARKTYAPEMKAAIIEAARTTRAAGKPWADALAAAEAVGYTGSSDALGQMLRLAGVKKTAGRRVKAPKPKVKPAGKKRRGAKAAGAKRYDEATKAAIIAAAQSARAEGKNWAATFKLAKKAGYTGSLQGISKMIQTLEKRAGKPTRRPGRPAKAEMAVKRGPGRPPKAKPAEGAGLSALDAMIERIVKARVNAAIEQAIAALQVAKG